MMNVYRPPLGDIENCIKYLQQCISTIRTSDQIDIFIGGDSVNKSKVKTFNVGGSINFFD